MNAVEKLRKLLTGKMPNGKTRAEACADSFVNCALTIGDCAELLQEIDRLHERAERAEKLLGRFGEELVSTGCAPGDSDHQLSQFRRLLADAQSTREACARVCDERAKSAAEGFDPFGEYDNVDYARRNARADEAEACAAAIRAGWKS